MRVIESYILLHIYLTIWIFFLTVLYHFCSTSNTHSLKFGGKPLRSTYVIITHSFNKLHFSYSTIPLLGYLPQDMWDVNIWLLSPRWYKQLYEVYKEGKRINIYVFIYMLKSHCIYWVVICFSSSCVLFVASFSGLSICNCPFGIIQHLLRVMAMDIIHLLRVMVMDF